LELVYRKGGKIGGGTLENGTQSVSSRLAELAHVNLRDKVLDKIGETALT
jgi:hypothetical protein